MLTWLKKTHPKLEILRLKFMKATWFTQLKVSTAECGPPEVTMDMPANSWKSPTSSPHTGEACQPTASIGSISLPFALHSPQFYMSTISSQQW